MTDYGAYDDEPRRYKSTRTRPRGKDDSDFVEETTYVEKGKGPPPRDLVYRGRDREDSIEDIPRDFPPPSRNVRGYRDDYDDDPPPRRRRARSAAGGRSAYDDYDDDDDYAAAGAAGGYAASRRSGGGRGGRDRGRGDRDGYYSDEYERYDKYSDRGSSPRGERGKSGIEQTLEGLGLGGVAGALLGKNKDKDRSRSRRGSRDRDSRSSSRGEKGILGGRSERQWAQAAQAALVAGAIEAFRARNEPGGWSGNKGKRVATAAIGAGGIDKLVDRDPGNKSKRHLVEAVLGGLAANRLANGPRDRSGSRGRSRSGSRGGRSRSRSVFDRLRGKSRGRSVSSEGSRDGSRSRSKSKSNGHGLEKLAAGGAIAAAGKAIYDRVRSKSRGAKDRQRSASSSSEDSYVPSRSRRRDVGGPSRSINDGGPDQNGAVARRGPGGGGEGGREGGEGDKEGDGNGSDTSSSSALDAKRKKMRGKELLTAGLATVATIHAAHGVYQSMEGSEKRHRLVAEGEMTKEQAKKKRSKAWLQDAAAVGIAALGIKGAYSEWKEMNESRHHVKELEERRRGRQKRREKREKELHKHVLGGGRDGGGRQGGVGGYPGPSAGGAGRLPPPEDGYYDGDGPSAYHDGNPYAAGSLPPPPMGTLNGAYR